MSNFRFEMTSSIVKITIHFYMFLIHLLSRVVDFWSSTIGELHCFSEYKISNYFRDTFWILKGLLFSEMYETARGVIKNLGYMVDK